MILRIVAPALVLALLSAPSLVEAQSDEAAKAVYKAGATYYERGEYEKALGSFKDAYDLSKKPALFFNISLCHEKLGALDKAVEFLARYLKEAEDVPNRSNLEARLANMRKRLEAQKEQSPPVVVPPPEPEPEPDPVVQEPAPEPATQSAEPQPIVESDSGGMPASALVSFIAGGVGLVTFGVFAGLALGEDSSLSDGCGANGSCSDDEVSTLETYTLVADIGLGVGVVGVALGLVFWLTADSDDGESVAEGDVKLRPWRSENVGGAELIF